jgi:biotin transporter BioY
MSIPGVRRVVIADAIPEFAFRDAVLVVGCAALVGLLAQVVAGNAIIYLAGVSWLMAAIHVDVAAAVSLGLTPFLLGDAIKAPLAAGLLPTTWKLVGR